MCGETVNELSCVVKLVAHSVDRMQRPRADSERKKAAMDEKLLQELLVKPTVLVMLYCYFADTNTTRRHILMS